MLGREQYLPCAPNTDWERRLLTKKNITVESNEQVGTVSFDSNGSELGTPEHSYVLYTQFTPTARGQFEEFVPRGNLINACLSEEYSSTTGMTFVYMTGRDKKSYNC